MWTTPRDEFTRSFSTPVIWEADGVKQIVVAGALQLIGYDVRSGERRWWVNGLARLVSSTPAVSGGVIYVSSWSMGGDADERISIPLFADAVKQHDKNGDGAISKSELPEGGQIQRRFFRVDLDQNGTLDDAEWKKQADIFLCLLCLKDKRELSLDGIWFVALITLKFVTVKVVR